MPARFQDAHHSHRNAQTRVPLGRAGPTTGRIEASPGFLHGSRYIKLTRARSRASIMTPKRTTGSATFRTTQQSRSTEILRSPGISPCSYPSATPFVLPSHHAGQALVVDISTPCALQRPTWRQLANRSVAARYRALAALTTPEDLSFDTEWCITGFTSAGIDFVHRRKWLSARHATGKLTGMPYQTVVGFTGWLILADAFRTSEPH